MSPLYTYNGILLSVNGRLAINENCCCEDDPPEPPYDPENPEPQCQCSNDCDQLSISLGGNPQCFFGNYSDEIACGDFGNITASMSCFNGSWSVFVNVFCFFNQDNSQCFYNYSAVLPCEADNKPPAGPVNLNQDFGFDDTQGKCPPVPPFVTILK